MFVKYADAHYISFNLFIFTISALMLKNFPGAIFISAIISSISILFYRIGNISKNNYFIFEQPHFIYKSSFKTELSNPPTYSQNKNDILQIDFTKLPTQFPKCPNCGSEMNIKTALYGDHRGGRFWGCSKFRGHNRFSCKTMLHLYDLTELE